MTCRHEPRHEPGDPGCGLSVSRPREVRAFLRRTGALEKAGLEDAADDLDGRDNALRTGATVADMRRVGTNVVIKAKSKAGEVVLVFIGVSELDLLRWPKIPLGFDGGANQLAAMFPATDSGWNRAIAFAGDPDFERGRIEYERDDR